jgi:hypothetical protein
MKVNTTLKDANWYGLPLDPGAWERTNWRLANGHVCLGWRELGWPFILSARTNTTSSTTYYTTSSTTSYTTSSTTSYSHACAATGAHASASPSRLCAALQV